ARRASAGASGSLPSGPGRSFPVAWAVLSFGAFRQRRQGTIARGATIAPKMIRIVPARAADADAVTACVRAAYAEYVERIGREPAPMGADYAALIGQGAVWVVRDGDAIAGVLVLRPQPPSLLLENVAVAPGHRGRGLGRALIGHAEERARAGGFDAVTLYTNERM